MDNSIAVYHHLFATFVFFRRGDRLVFKRLHLPDAD